MLAGCWLIAAATFAQMGGIRGVVMDQDFEVPLPGVKVRISETGQEAVTGDAGSYYLEKVEPGAYTLLFSKGGYTRFTQPQVVVTAGQLAEVEASMAGEYEEMDELVVRDIQLGGSSEIGLLNLRMESSALMDSVGADLMSKAGASDAAQALTLVPGTTIQDGKYAVVRGLPDRYVNSQMNGVRLPTADPDKRAVQLDQFPSAMIESVQVSKTFTPDQQGDASGGAVNIVLKGIPDERVLRFSVGTEYNEQLFNAKGHFLVDNGVSLSTWGHDAGGIKPLPAGSIWNGSVGVERDDEIPIPYKWSVTAGDKAEIGNGIKIGAFGSIFYSHDASYYEGGKSDRLWQEFYTDRGTGQDVYGSRLTPQYSGVAYGYDYGTQTRVPSQGNAVNTELYDVTEGAEEIQWGTLGAIGVETENHALNLLYAYNHSAESEAVLLEDTRGKYYFFPNHDPNDSSSEGHEDADQIAHSPFRRNETLTYTERTSDTLQLKGKHTLPLKEMELGSVLATRDPELDWTLAKSSSILDIPHQRLFQSEWQAFGDGTGRYLRPSSAGDGEPVLSRVWRYIQEDSDQYFGNAKLPLDFWNDEEGFIKMGIFHDKIERRYEQDSYESGVPPYTAGWDGLWSTYASSQPLTASASPVDVNYNGDQEISAWYYMAEVPVFSFLKFVGGARFESTEIQTTIVGVDASSFLKLYLPPSYAGVDPYAIDPASGLSNIDKAGADISQDDVLPSLGFEFSPLDKIIVRATYAETISRMTFKELTPIEQREYLGADTFIGNPDLKLSALKNYDLRFDYNPYPGGLVSVSLFYKDIKDPIEYRRVLLDGSTLATTAENYPEGTMNGYEAEVRQSLGLFWDALEGFEVGGNFTSIESEVTVSEAELFNTPDKFREKYGDRTTRPMLNAPEFLYNINATYRMPRWKTDFGLFYTVKGDTLLVAGGNKDSNYVPDLYAKERGTLNLSISQPLGEHLKLSFKAKNLTDSPVEEIYKSDYLGQEATRRSYKKGIDFSLEISGIW